MTIGTVTNKRNPFLAALATFGTFGLGQLYNGKHKKAAVAYMLWIAIATFTLLAPLSANIMWLLASQALLYSVGLIVMIDAFRNARSLREISLRPYNRWYIYLAIVLLQVLVVSPPLANLLLSSIRAYKIPTSTMRPALEIGDRLVADMKAYKNKLPSRGDLIVFKYPTNESISYVKRVIGLPGEKLEIIKRTVYINGEPLKENYVQYIDPNSIHEHCGPYDIPQGQYFVMGDNRDNSQDSRFWGFVKQHQLLGQARYLYWAKDKSRIGKQVN